MGNNSTFPLGTSNPFNVKCAAEEVANGGLPFEPMTLLSRASEGLKSHDSNKKKWTHYSFFEVHDNVFTEEIRELETLLLGIFGHDPRIKLLNMQTGSKKLSQSQSATWWKVQ